MARYVASRLHVMELSEVKAKVAELVYETLSIPRDRKIDFTTPLSILGSESFMRIELRTRLESGFGIELYPAFLYDFLTVNAIASYIKEALSGVDGARSTTPQLETSGGFAGTLDAIASAETGRICTIKGLTFPEDFVEWESPKKEVIFEKCTFNGAPRLIGDQIQFRSCIIKGILHVSGNGIGFTNCDIDGLVSCRDMNTLSISSCDFDGSCVISMAGNLEMHLLDVRPRKSELIAVHMLCWNDERPELSGSVKHASARCRFVGLRFTNFDFHKMMIEDCAFVNCEWGWETPLERLKIPEKARSPESLEQVYRDLRQAFERGGDRAKAIRARMSELEMRRRRKFFISWEFLYKLVSNYGASWVRPAVFALLVWTAFLVFGALSMEYPTPYSDFENFFKYHVRNTIYAPVERKDLELGLVVISALSKTMTTALLVLSGFAIRRRFW